MQPKVVIGIVTRDREKILPKAIDSALAQNYGNLAVCVSNDGSIDDTSEVADRYPQITWIDWPESQGYVAARNYLMRQDRDADYFASLDDDSRFVNGDEVSLAVDYLEAHPDVAVVAFDILSPDNQTARQRGEPHSTPTFIGCGHVVRLAAIKKTGGYVAAPGGYGGEEKDLSLRIMDAGYKLVLMAGVHVWHDKTAVARDLTEQHCSGVCNDFAMTLRRTPLLLLPFALHSKFHRHFRFSRAHRLLPSFWKGLRLFLRSVPELWQTREPVRFSTLQKYLKISRDRSCE